MDLQTLGTIIGILSGVFTLAGGVVGVFDRMRGPAKAARVPAPIGAYPSSPPVSNVSGPSAHPGSPGPAPGYPGPAFSQPGAAQPGYPQPSAAAPRPGYGMPPGPWGNVPQPINPSPMQPSAPYAAYAPRSGISRWVHYPWVLLGAATYFILGAIYSGMTSCPGSTADSATCTTNTNDPVAIFISLLVFAAYLATVIYAARLAIRLRRWGWLASIILIPLYGAAAFGIFGPTTPPQPKYASPYPPRGR